VNKEEYIKLVNSKSKNTNVLENALISFLVGGIIGATAEILVRLYSKVFNLNTELSLALMCLTVVIVSVILTGIGIFDKMVSKYKFGLIIPTTGFAHSIASAIIDYRKDGFITGIGSNAFKLAGSVILYGIVSAFLFTILKVIIYG